MIPLQSYHQSGGPHPSAARTCTITGEPCLEQARPSSSDILSNGRLRPRPLWLPETGTPPAPAGLAEGGAQQLETTQKLDWTEVWLHALNDVEVVVVARMALDDANAAVVAAAADLVLCILAGHGGPQEAVFEAADAHPYTGGSPVRCASASESLHASADICGRRANTVRRPM